MEVGLKQELVRRGSGLDDQCFLTYVALRMMMRKDKTEYSVTVDGIIGELFQRWNCIRKYRQRIPVHMQFLADAGYIKIINAKTYQNTDESNGTAYILDLSEMETKGDKFVSITDTDIHTILNIPGKCDSISLLRYFCVIVSTINNETKVGNLKLSNIIDYMEEAICPKTQYNYNELLHEHKLLYFHKFETDRVFPDGGIKSFSHIYGLYKNMESVEDEAKKMMRKYRLDGTYELIYKSNKRNLAKSVKQKIHFIEKGYVYSLDDLLQMKRNAEDINANYQDIISRSEDPKIIEKYKGMMVDTDLIDSRILEMSNNNNVNDNREIG